MPKRKHEHTQSTKTLEKNGPRLSLEGSRTIRGILAELRKIHEKRIALAKEQNNDLPTQCETLEAFETALVTGNHQEAATILKTIQQHTKKLMHKFILSRILCHSHFLDF